MISSRHNIFSNIISSLFILIFVYTAITKMFSIGALVYTLRKLDLLTDMAPYMAWFIVTGELAISLLLLFTTTRLLGLYASLALMSIFTVYIAYMLITASHLPCSCGGIIQKLSWKGHLVLNTFLVFVAAFGIYYERKRLKFLLQ
jgi:hypothetical protein